MTDVVVTLSIERGGLFHLQEKTVDSSYWEMKRKPKHLTEADKVFICTEGEVHGYFEIDEIYFDSKWNIMFEDESWTEIEQIKMKGFQGFRYRKFEYQVKEYEQ